MLSFLRFSWDHLFTQEAMGAKDALDRKDVAGKQLVVHFATEHVVQETDEEALEEAAQTARQAGTGGPANASSAKPTKGLTAAQKIDMLKKKLAEMKSKKK